ncbi:hypothetical protein KC19_9G022600 [Ceratodon purpureus]|uniref:Uncharacterized protein n=1 Tax=Ceratodon purpureus TaxID=3225 RepID=A0A8T0GVF8_CERPU|nr:hypothetical protein KC19_9G022600 [Ceratodon purpureus]
MYVSVIQSVTIMLSGCFNLCLLLETCTHHSLNVSSIIHTKFTLESLGGF